MRIFSAFNTNSKDQLLIEYRALFWDDAVILVSRSKLYYYTHIGRVVFLYFLALAVSLYAMYSDVFVDYVWALKAWITFVPERIGSIVQQSWFWIFWLILGILLLRKVGKNYMHYAMDFLLVTPKEVIRHDQKWLFAKEVQKLHADKIKSVTIQKSWLLNSFLDIWSITFIAEWDNERGDITMDYVDAIEAQEKQVLHVLWLDKIG